MLPFWDVPFQPFIYVFLSLCSKQTKRHKDTFNWLEFETSELECRRKYWSYELEVPEPRKTYSNIVSTRTHYTSVFLPKNAMDSRKERIQRIIKEESRPRTSLKHS